MNFALKYNLGLQQDKRQGIRWEISDWIMELLPGTLELFRRFGSWVDVDHFLEKEIALERTKRVLNDKPNTAIDGVFGPMDKATYNGLKELVKANRGERAITAAELMSMDIQPPKIVVQSLLTEGLAILAARPKSGKSFLALSLCLTIANGGKAMGVLPALQGRSCYFALEDSMSRLKTRLESMLNGQPAPHCLDIYTALPPLDKGGMEAIQEYLTNNPDTALVVVDTLGKVKPVAKRGADLYQADYETTGALQKLALQHRCCILLVHHTRKMVSIDPTDSVSGTAGITGAADCLLVMSRTAEGMVLHTTGRDIAAEAYTLDFDDLTSQWIITGVIDPNAANVSGQRKQILGLLGTGPLTPKQIEIATGISSDVVRQTLSRMAKAGQVMKDGYGVYSLPSNGSHSVTPSQ